MLERTEEELRAIFGELTTQTDRGAAIVAAAIVEEYLTTVIKGRLILTKAIEERIFSADRRGFASEFGAKLDLGYCLGIIRKEIYDDLRLIAKIRNRFAHSVDPLRFTDEKITGWCRSITTLGPDPLEFEPRYRYMTACVFIIGLLSAVVVAKKLRVKTIREDPALYEEVLAIIEATPVDEDDPSTSPKK
jgi:hypothetical protein